jgi:signal transduction histidine kinase
MDPLMQLVHDLRSPLGSVVLLSEALPREAIEDPGDPRRRKLILLHDAGLALTALLSEAVDVPTGDDGLLEGAPAPFSMGEVFQSVADLLGPLAATKGLSLRMVPPARDGRLGQPPALRRVLLNLATDALKYTEEGWVEMSATPHLDQGLLISVRDTGRGLSPSMIEAFGRPLPQPSADEGQRGGRPTLGLRTCRALVRSMGSELEFETWPGLGTRFHFALDLQSLPAA